MIRKRYTYILIALNLIVPIFLATSVNGSWVTGTQITLNGIIDDIQPSISFNERNGTVFYSYTYYFEDEGTSDIYLSNNSANTGYASKAGLDYDEMGAIIMDDLLIEELTNHYKEPTQTSVIYTVNNSNSDVSVAGWSNEVWVVWQGRFNNSGSFDTDTDIFVHYRSDTEKWTQQLTFDSDNDISPKIVALNNSEAVVAWISNVETTPVINYVDISGSTIPSIENRGTNINEIELTKSGNPGSELVHLLYLTGGNNVYHESKTRGTTLFSSGISDYTAGVSCSNITLAAEGNYVAFACSLSNNDIYYERSNVQGSNFGTTGVAKSASGSSLMDPEIYVTNYGAIEIFYVDYVNDNYYDIYKINNFVGSWSAEDPIFRSRLPAGYRYYCPTVAYWNGTVVGLYNHQYNSGSGWGNIGEDLYIFGYMNFYDDGSDYSYFEIVNEEPPPSYLIEGINLVYNGTGADLDLNITISDSITGETYSNLTTIDGDGGQQRYTFYDPNNYMITKNAYNLTIRWENTGTQVIQVPFDPTILADYLDENGTVIDYYEYNITSNYFPEGFNPVYDFYTDNIAGPQIGISLEVGTGRFTKDEEGIAPGIFTNVNHADFGIIKMEKEERYNFTFTTSNSNFKAYMFNDSVQTLDPSKAIYTFDSSQQYYDIYCSKTDDYFVLIQKEDYSSTGSYTFQYELCPRNVTLQTPLTGSYFNWDTTKLIELKWNKYVSDTDIDLYYLQVSNNSEFSNATGGVKQYGGFNADLRKSMNFTDIIPDQWYYWRVKAVDNDGNHGYYDSIKSFTFDEDHPTQPIIFAPEPVITEKTFEVQWSASTDGIFPIAYYNVYRSTSPDFTPGPDNMITDEGFIHSNYTDTVTKNDRYYYIVEAVDNVGHTSLMSPMQTFTISYGGTVDAKDQKFQVQVGDIVEYEITWIQSEDNDLSGKPYMNFREKLFQQGTKFHFWIKDIDKTDVLPVRGDWYTLSANTSYQDSYVLQETDLYLQPFITNNNATYQRNVFDLYIIQNFPGFVLGSSMNVTNYTSTWSDGINVRDVRAFTYFEAPDEDYSQTTITFVVDINTGVLVEMTFYDRQLNYGYALKLVETSAELSISDWTYGPLIIPAIIISVAAIVYVIMKKIEL